MSNQIIDNNIKNIRQQIVHKQSCTPHHATVADIQSIVTDYDHFPYSRFYKGVYNHDNPIIAEREAGYRPRYPQQIQTNCDPIEEIEPNHCFQSACSTIYPCFTDHHSIYKGVKNLRGDINNKCIVQYR